MNIILIMLENSLSVRVGQSTHKNYISIFFYNEHERMARVELNGLDAARNVFQIVIHDVGACTK